MKRTCRTPQQVVDAALAAMKSANWHGASGADADHLKTTADVDITSAAGFTFYTIDPSDFVDGSADDYDGAQLQDKFAKIRAATPWYETYLNCRVPLPNGSAFELDGTACMRCAVKYGRALEHALMLAQYIGKVNDAAGRAFEIELSIDETPQPTSLAEHYIIADQFRQAGVKLVSIAPKFYGDFEKGIDFKGDLGQFERSLIAHAQLARELGPYKLSLHSGSDKLSLYPILAEATRGCFHVKTAGTSYLEALRVVARHDGTLFRQIIEAARRHYNTDKATYHVSAEVGKLPGPEQVKDVSELETIYLGRWSEVPLGRGFTQPGRQVLHCTFGTILTDQQIGPAIHQLLRANTGTFTEVLADHFERHLRALAGAM
jgi:hypothetical protein